jgi:DNA-binding GntR family transcriptional regulator
MKVTSARSRSDSRVDQVYAQLKRMAAGYEFKPGERINEVELARRLGASRTPLREALNRLATEGFFTFAVNHGFFCRELDPVEVFDLYELRNGLEQAAAALAVARAKLVEIEELEEFLARTSPAVLKNETIEVLVKLDETFHERLVAMSGNHQMLRVLENINARIRFVRWIDMERVGREKTQAEHRAIVKAMRERDQERCLELLDKHISRRREQIVAAIKEGLASIYISRGRDKIFSAAVRAKRTFDKHQVAEAKAVRFTD